MDGLTSILGSRLPNPKPHKGEDRRVIPGPPVLASRQAAIADALGPARCEAIAEQAKAEAARIMAEWERRRGRK